MVEHNHRLPLGRSRIVSLSPHQESLLLDEGGTPEVSDPSLGVGLLVGEESALGLDGFEELLDASSHFYKDDGQGAFKFDFLNPSLNGGVWYYVRVCRWRFS